jgi:CDP-glycerol glycerophosphotransferase (TagB/SpsB family)
VLDWFAGQDDFNLIFAPHIRLFQSASRKTRARLQAAAVPDKILVDPGSARSCDMTYTLAADIYLGDVSSQVYEFISTPRPCVFLDAHRTAWTHDPNFACWYFGEVVQTMPDLVQALRQARVRHSTYAPRQAAAWSAAMAAESGEAPILAAAHIREFLQGQTIRIKSARPVQPPMAGAVEPLVLETT